ncbi:cytochrome P450 4c3-like [Ornithodoros turicata]|uniref:cytochrome P450 4c3-like n=1 Tax=Ornithodoros turicata TaxID=34597 RepID=UPI0031397C48
MSSLMLTRILPNASQWVDVNASFIAVTSIVFLLALYAKTAFRHLRTYWYLRKVPRPLGQWSFKTLYEMWKTTSKMDGDLTDSAKSFIYFKRMFQRAMNDDIAVIYFGATPMLLGWSPETVEGILSKVDNQNKPFLYDFMKPWNGDGILTLETALWRVRRKAFTPAFHFKILDDYNPVMNRRSTKLVQKLEGYGGEYVDLLPVIRTAGFGIFFETAMGLNVDEEEEVKHYDLLRGMEVIGTRVVQRMLNFFLWSDITYGLCKESKAFYHYANKIRSYNTGVMRKKVAEYEESEGQKNKTNRFIDVMLRMFKEDGSLQEVDLVDEIVAAFVGGFETTSLSMSYALHLLGSHPEVQRKVHEELDVVFGDDKDRPVTKEDAKELKYLECVIKETLRLFPPLPILGRDFRTDTTIGGHTIPKGTVGLVLLYFLHRNPKVYENPNDFIPERFLETSAKHHPFAFIPFAGGLRNCLGQNYAKTEEKIVLSHILRNFRVISKVPTEDIKIDMELMLRPMDKLLVKFIPRDKAT